MMKKIKLRFNSIRIKLFISLIGVCVLPMAALGVTSYIESKSILTDKLESTSSQLLREVDRGIEKELTAMGNNVSMLANNYDFTNIETNPEYAPYLIDFLKGIKDNNKNIQTVYMGTVTKDFYRYPKADIGSDFDPTSRPWYKNAIENKGKVVFSDPYKSVSTDKTVVSISKTVEKDGQLVGVVSMDIDFSTVSKGLSEIKIGNDGYAMLLDKNGLLLTHPDEKLIGTDTFAKIPVWTEIREKGSGFTSYNYNGQKKYAAYVKSAVAGWTVIGAMEENELSRDTSIMLKTLIIFLLITGAIGLLISLLITKSLSVNISIIKDIISKASEGDLTVTAQIHSKDEMGLLAKDFNRMIDNISGMLINVEKSSKIVLETASNLTAMTEETTASVSEVSRAIDEISHGAVEQASSTHEAASGMEELAGGLDQISNSAAEIDSISESTKNLSGKGLEIVEVLLGKSKENVSVSRKVSELIDDMNLSAREINKISDSINQITAQTNLLSLNASIEAARAGEAGRGFAIVADEIRKLAEQSKNSTEEIKKIVEVIQGKSNTAVTTMEEAWIIVAAQNKAVEETNEIFSEINNSINGLRDMIHTVKEQIVNINIQKEEVISQVESVSSISEETASSSEEVSASTEQINATMEEFNKYVLGLQSLSEKLNDELDRFKLK